MGKRPWGSKDFWSLFLPTWSFRDKDPTLYKSRVKFRHRSPRGKNGGQGVSASCPEAGLVPGLPRAHQPSSLGPVRIHGGPWPPGRWATTSAQLGSLLEMQTLGAPDRQDVTLNCIPKDSTCTAQSEGCCSMGPKPCRPARSCPQRHRRIVIAR